MGGSHITAIYDLAIILADSGHQVTFVNIVSGGLGHYTPHPNIHTVDMVVWDQDKHMMYTHCLQRVVQGPSSGALAFPPGCSEVWHEVYTRSAGVYTGERVLELFKTTHFDLILGEKVEMNGMAILGTVTNVPVVNFEPTFLITFSQLHTNMPLLLSSQPSLLYTRHFDHSPTFTERVYELSNIFTLIRFANVGIQAMQPFLEKFGFSRLDEVRDSVKLFLTNDHPAFTFPFLRPPNDIPIGCSNILGTRNDPLQLPVQVLRFLEESVGRDVVYVSFGSLVVMDQLSWFTEIIDILTKLDLRVIVRVGKGSVNKFPESVLPLSWAPQKQLLRSGKLKLFISHCGNNGRLETIYYNVPVLCVPQFGDQPVNTEIIKLNGFGEILKKEEISSRTEELVTTMIANHGAYYEKLKKASDVVDAEPGNVRDNLVFYVEQVARYKNVDYLVNKVIKQQRFIQINNVDILVTVCGLLLIVFVLISSVLVKTCVYLGRQMKPKKSNKE